MTQKKSTAVGTNWKALLSEDADLMRELVRHVMQEIWTCPETVDSRDEKIVFSKGRFTWE